MAYTGRPTTGRCGPPRAGAPARRRAPAGAHCPVEDALRGSGRWPPPRWRRCATCPGRGRRPSCGGWRWSGASAPSGSAPATSGRWPSSSRRSSKVGTRCMHQSPPQWRTRVTHLRRGLGPLSIHVTRRVSAYDPRRGPGGGRSGRPARSGRRAYGNSELSRSKARIRRVEPSVDTNAAQRAGRERHRGARRKPPAVQPHPFNSVAPAMIGSAAWRDRRWRPPG